MEVLDIRFSKVHFYLTFPEKTVMPRDKASAFRGGIGEMLLRANCISDRECERCSFRSECLVQKIMYAKSQITPRSVTEGESMGYVFDCENKETDFAVGDEICLTLTLFGNNILYFQLYLQALAALGAVGIGKNKSRFVISRITNLWNEPILDGQNILMERYRHETIGTYVAYRLRQIKDTQRLSIEFQSPATLKYQGEILQEFDLTAIYKAAARRVYMLDCFEGIVYEEAWNQLEMSYEIVKQKVIGESVQRYSNHKKQKMKLEGIKGLVELQRLEQAEGAETFLKVLLAGEILHIGKNTSFGFGKYRIK